MLNRVNKWRKECDFSQASDDGRHYVRYVDNDNNAFEISKWDALAEFTVAFEYVEGNGVRLQNVEMFFNKLYFARYFEFEGCWHQKIGTVDDRAIYSFSICTADKSQLKFFIDDIHHATPFCELLDEIYSCVGIKSCANHESKAKGNPAPEICEAKNIEASHINELIRQRQLSELQQQSSAESDRQITKILYSDNEEYKKTKLI